MIYSPIIPRRRDHGHSGRRHQPLGVAVPSEPSRLIQLRLCALEFIFNGAATRFPEGAFIEAQPRRENIQYHVIADRLRVLAYCREHDLYCGLVEEHLENGPCPVLWAFAHGDALSGRDAASEELKAQVAPALLSTESCS